MAYKFTEKTNNIQQQTVYAVYMIVGSYFHKSICRAKALETSLLLYYREIPGKRQEILEDRVIAYAGRELKSLLPILSEMNCEVSIRHGKENFYLEFETGFESVSAVVDRQGKYHIQVSGKAAA